MYPVSIWAHLYLGCCFLSYLDRAAWKEPCIVLCPHWSLRLGPAVHLLRHWHADKRCLLVVEVKVRPPFAEPNIYLLLIDVVLLLNCINLCLQQGNGAELSLKPFMPLAIQVLECSFLSGVRYIRTSLCFWYYRLYVEKKDNFLDNRAGKIDPLLGVLKPKFVMVWWSLFPRV
jgi:integrator complex subunit 9